MRAHEIIIRVSPGHVYISPVIADPDDIPFMEIATGDPCHNDTWDADPVAEIFECKRISGTDRLVIKERAPDVL